MVAALLLSCKYEQHFNKVSIDCYYCRVQLSLGRWRYCINFYKSCCYKFICWNLFVSSFIALDLEFVLTTVFHISRFWNFWWSIFRKKKSKYLHFIFIEINFTYYGLNLGEVSQSKNGYRKTICEDCWDILLFSSFTICKFCIELFLGLLRSLRTLVRRRKFPRKFFQRFKI